MFIFVSLFVSFFLRVFHKKIDRFYINCIVISSLLFSFGSVLLLAFKGNIPVDVIRFPFISLYKGEVEWFLSIDFIALYMLILVYLVSLCVNLYSIGYMKKDKRYIYYYSYLHFFTFMMCLLVTSTNFLTLFVAWEGVGVASYLLIGFWNGKKSACLAAKKAFLYNRIADAFFILAMCIVYKYYGSFSFEILEAGMPEYVKELLGLSILIASMGKSAQFLFFPWLPDAMEGPTPVSALIHAATMVTAGVILIIRCFPFMQNSNIALNLTGVFGAITIVFAGLCALYQNDIKKIVAFSTCSQIGYMFLALAIFNSPNVGFFHLYTHGFFKALLFLCCGCIIYYANHNQDIRKMGGLYYKIPSVFFCTLVGGLAMMGLGIPGTNIGFLGFFSKDLILEGALEGYLEHPSLRSFFIVLCSYFGVLLTSLYTWRLIKLVFFSSPNREEKGLNIPVSMLFVIFFLSFFMWPFFGIGLKGLFLHGVDIPHIKGIFLWIPFCLNILGLVSVFLFELKDNSVIESGIFIDRIFLKFAVSCSRIFSRISYWIERVIIEFFCRDIFVHIYLTIKDFLIENRIRYLSHVVLLTVSVISMFSLSLYFVYFVLFVIS